MQPARICIESLLTRGELEAALDGYLLLCRHYNDAVHGSEAAHQSARYHDLMSQQRSGTIHQEDYRLERARINRAMLDLAQKIPAEWTDTVLEASGFSGKKNASPTQKGFWGKWGIALGLALLLFGVAGVLLREQILPKNKTAAVQPVSPAPGSEDTRQQSPAAARTAKTQAPPTDKPAATERRVPSGERQIVKKVSPTTPTSGGRFRSFAKTVISNGMERGKIDGKMAFRNVRTGEILCCYADAEDFSNGKAYVSKDGVKYIYINNKGEELR